VAAVAAVAADMAAEAAEAAVLLPVAAEVAAVLLPAASAAWEPVQVSVDGVAGALQVSMALADAHFTYTADAHFLDAASAAVAVAAEAGAAELAGYGQPGGVGSTPAGPNLHLRVKNLASRRSQSDR
jgi:hypothetical protein